MMEAPRARVGACACKVTTSTDLRETSGPRIDRIPPTRPPWRRRQYRDIKKLIFLTPSTCPIDVFGPVASRTINKCMAFTSKATKRVRNSCILLFKCFWIPIFAIYVSTRVPAAVTHHSFHAGDVCQHTCTPSTLQPHSSLCTLGPHTTQQGLSSHSSQHDDHPTAATMGRTAAPRSDERILPAHAIVACAHALARIHDADGAARGAQALRARALHRRASRRRRDTGVGG